MLLRVLILFLAMAHVAGAQTNAVILVTLNCYWFMGVEKSPRADKPRTAQEYQAKANNLIHLLPAEPPLFIGLQEIGNESDSRVLAEAASRRYGRNYEAVFTQGNDMATRLDVGALWDTSRGWSLSGKPGRAAELQRQIAQHLVVRLTKAQAGLDLAVVSLREPQDARAVVAQIEQNRALARWAMRLLGKDPQAKIAILGGFNELNTPGSLEQTLTPLLEPNPGFVDPFSNLQGKARTHFLGKAFDRILLSPALAKNGSGLKFESVAIHEHPYASAAHKRLYTDHFPVSVRLSVP